MHKETIHFLYNYLQKHPFDDIEIQIFSIAFYQSGGGSHIFTLKTARKRYAVRVNYYEKKNEWGVKETEFEILTSLEKMQYDYAPRAYLFCRHDDVENLLAQDFIVVDFIEGVDFSMHQLTYIDIKNLAVGLRSLHTLDHKTTDIPYTCEVFDEFANGEDKQIEKYSGLDFEGIGETYETYNTYKQELAAWFRSLAIFGGVSQEVLCHADIKKENVLRTQSGVCFIDWECAGYDIWETDIGRLFSGFQFTNEQKILFMNEYCFEETTDLVVDLRIRAVEITLNFFRILDQYCIRKVVPWNPDSFKTEYRHWHETFTIMKSEA